MDNFNRLLDFNEVAIFLKVDEASWHRQAGTSCDELKDLGGWKSREMVDRYAKYGTEHLAVAAMRIQRVRAENVSNNVTFLSRSTMTKDLATG